MGHEIKAFFDSNTFTLTYLIHDPGTGDGIIIDPVLDYAPASSTVSTKSVDALRNHCNQSGIHVRMILETHAHADHLSGAQELKKYYPEAVLAVGSQITEVQRTFKTVFDLPEDFPTDGRQFDRLFNDDETVEIGSLSFGIIFTPGHTPACATYKFGDDIFTGDTLFMPDFGTGRCDFPAGSAADLYESIQERLYTLPDHTRVFVGHDYQPGGRELRYQSTIAEQKANNIQLPANRTKDEFVKFRTERDQTLQTPKLLFQSVQVNVDAGALPTPSKNEVRYLKIPVNIFKPTIDEENQASGSIVEGLV